MPRRPRHATGQFVFHVVNRAIENAVLFEEPQDFEAFLRLLAEAVARFHILLFAYVLMHNHWHLLLRAPDGNLSAFMHWLTGTHVRRWRNARGNAGRGALYQGRFKAVAVQDDQHFLCVCRYVERNPLKARLIGRAEDWRWSSASQHAPCSGRPSLAEWPVPKPPDWRDLVNVPDPSRIVTELRRALQTGMPFGSDAWQARTLEALGLRTRTRRITIAVDDRSHFGK